MNEKRVKLSNVHIVEKVDDEVEIEVSLSYGEYTQSNKIVSSNQQHHRLRSVAHATVQALNELLSKLVENKSIIFGLLDFRTVVLSNINHVVFLVVIEITETDEKSFVSGSSIARIEALDIEEEAKFNVARAILNATNRKLTKYI